jgi:hypothetical protein
MKGEDADETTAGIPRKKIGPLIPTGGYNLQMLQKIAYHTKIPSWIMVTLLTHRTVSVHVFKYPSRSAVHLAFSWLIRMPFLYFSSTIIS